MSDAVNEVIESAKSVIEGIDAVLQRDALREGESDGERLRRHIVALSTLLGRATATATIVGVPAQVVTDEMQAWHLLGADFVLHEHDKVCVGGAQCEHAAELRAALKATTEALAARMGVDAEEK